MTDHDALLAAVLAQPDDDLPRLVYADFIEEQGQDDRAMFIRWQCALAKLEAEPVRVCFQDDRCASALCQPCWKAALLGWQFDLLNENYKTWGRELPGTYTATGCSHKDCQIHLEDSTAWSGPVSVGFRRGFIESITCPSECWTTHHAAILARLPIRQLTLADWPVTIARSSMRHHFNVHLTYQTAEGPKVKMGTVPVDDFDQGAVQVRLEKIREAAIALFAQVWPGIKVNLPEGETGRRGRLVGIPAGRVEGSTTSHIAELDLTLPGS